MCPILDWVIKMEYLSNLQKAEEYRENYKAWKESTMKFGFFPVFLAFKDTYLLKKLSGNAVKLYIYLGLMSGNMTGETWVSIESISKYFGKSKRTISNWVKELEQENLIVRMQMEYNGVSHTYLQPYGKDL